MTAANCVNTGLQIPVQIAEYAVTSGIYCGANLASVAGSTTPNVIKGKILSKSFHSIKQSENMYLPQFFDFKIFSY